MRRSSSIVYETLGIEGYNKFTFKAVSTLIGGFAIHCLVGAQYIWGNISMYVAGYYRDLGQDVNMSEFFLVLPIITLLSTLLCPLGMYCSEHVGPKISILVGGTICTLGVFFAGITSSSTQFIFLFSISFGLGKGFLYPVALEAGWTHLPGRKGFVSGFITSGMGIGPFILAIIANQIVNPNNLEAQPEAVNKDSIEYYFPNSVNSRIPYLMNVLALIFTGIIIFGMLTITNYPKKGRHSTKQHQKQVNATYTSLTMSEPDPIELAEKNIDKKVLLKSKEFWHLYFWSLTFMFFGFYMMSTFKTFGATEIKDDVFLTLIGSFGTLVNGFSRLIISSLLDYYSFRNVFGVLVIMQLLAISIIQWSLAFPALYFIVIMVSMCCQGAMAAVLPTMTLQVFGTMRGPEVYAYLYSSFGAQAALGGILVATLQYKIGYMGLFMICFILTLIAGHLTLRFEKQQRYDYLKAYYKVIPKNNYSLLKLDATHDSSHKT